jgi:hypothetical protein
VPGLHAAVGLLDGQNGSITIITPGKSALLGRHFPPELISAKVKRWKQGDIHIVEDLQALNSLWPCPMRPSGKRKVCGLI